MENLMIGQLAKRAQVNIETIRYYERRGLIPKPLRRASGYRQYAQQDIERICFIKHAKALGFTLNEISELLSLKVEPAATCRDIAQRIDAKLADVERKIKILHGMKKTLVKLKRACKTPSAPSKECPILESLDTEAHENDEKEPFE